MTKSLLTEAWQGQLATYDTVWMGFSGGLDSTVLLHLLAHCSVLRQKLKAVHIHHGLSANATAWSHHCQQYCDALSIPLFVFHVDVERHRNVEEQARKARYAVFSSLLTDNDGLLLAHHQDDQAETLLLQLFRGAGIDGLAAMAPVKPLGLGTMARPLLDYPRQTLEMYAKTHGLTWVEDESNASCDFSRNYLRHQIMPLLKNKWPGVVQNVVRSANHCQEAQRNLDALAILDSHELAVSSLQLNLRSLLTLERARLVNVIRVWLKKNQIKRPSSVMLTRLIDEVIFARRDATPFLAWGEVCIRRYKHTLYLFPQKKNMQRETCIDWSTFPMPLEMSEHHHLHATLANEGLVVPPGSRVQIRFWQVGDVFYWHGQTKSLKKLWQAWGVPPWERDTVPLLYINGTLAVVIGFAIGDHHYGVAPTEPIYRVCSAAVEGA